MDVEVARTARFLALAELCAGPGLAVFQGQRRLLTTRAAMREGRAVAQRDGDAVESIGASKRQRAYFRCCLR